MKRKESALLASEEGALPTASAGKPLRITASAIEAG
jgi:hypothetical protein